MNAIELLELSSPGCQHCAAFREWWETQKESWPNVTIKEMSILDPEGQELVQKHQIFASPGIFLNGELISTGGVNKDQFLAKVKELSG